MLRKLSRGQHIRNSFVVRNSRYALSTSTSQSLPILVSPDDAIRYYQSESSVKFLDATWHLDKTRNANNEYILEVCNKFLCYL